MAGSGKRAGHAVHNRPTCPIAWTTSQRVTSRAATAPALRPTGKSSPGRVPASPGRARPPAPHEEVPETGGMRAHRDTARRSADAAHGWPGRGKAVAFPSRPPISLTPRTDPALRRHVFSRQARMRCPSALASPLSTGEPAAAPPPHTQRPQSTPVPRRHARRPERRGVVITWSPYHSSTGKPPRIRGVSCCDAYQFGCQGARYLILRRNSVGDLEETARGPHQRARAIWRQLLIEHADDCSRQGHETADIWL